MAVIDTFFFDELSHYKDYGLRDYQAYLKCEIYTKWKDISSILLQMPTGTGKTRLFVSMINDFKQYSESHNVEVKVLIVTHRKELVDQIKSELFYNYNIKSTLITAENKDSHTNPRPVCVASIQTLHRRLERHWHDYPFDFVIIDEAHHTKATTYKKVIKAYPGAKFLGVTATPYRLNGEGFTDEYQELIISPSVKRFIEAGWLSNYDYYSIKEDSDLYQGLEDVPLDKYGEYATTPLWNYIGNGRIRSEIVGSYLKYAKGKKAIIYTINKAHNKQLCAEFKQCGIIARDIDSDTNADERKRIVAAFRQGDIDVLCNVDIFTEGFDCPDVEVIQLARPTKSLGLYLQQVGRGLRVAAGKRKVMFLDNVGLHNRFGFPASKRMWRKHYIGQEIDENSHFVLKECKEEEPFEMGGRHRDLSEGCEKMMLLESTGFNKIIENAKINYQVEREKRLKYLIEAVFKNNQLVYDEYVSCYSEYNMSFTSELKEDLVTPCTHINSECKDILYWKNRIKLEIKPVIKGNEIVYESYEDLDEYMRIKSKMILSRFMDELSKSRAYLFQELDDYTAEQMLSFFTNEYGTQHIMTKKMLAFAQHGYSDFNWIKMARMWDSPKLESPIDDNCKKRFNTKNRTNSPEEFKVGDKVKHHLWGSGTINEIVLGNLLYSVDFDSLSTHYTFVKANTLIKDDTLLHGETANTVPQMQSKRNKIVMVGDWLVYNSKKCRVVSKNTIKKRITVEYDDKTHEIIRDDNSSFNYYNIDETIPDGMKRVSRKAIEGDVILVKRDLSVGHVIKIEKLGAFQKLYIKKENGQEDWLFNYEKLFWVLNKQ